MSGVISSWDVEPQDENEEGHYIHLMFQNNQLNYRRTFHKLLLFLVLHLHRYEDA